MLTKPPNIGVRCDGISFKDVYEVTKRILEDGLLVPGDYFHEMFMPYFVVVDVKRDPSVPTFGGVVSYTLASFFPLKNCGIPEDLVTNTHNSVVKSKLEDFQLKTFGKIESRQLYLFKVPPWFLIDRISYSSKLESFVADLTFGWAQSKLVIDIAKDERNVSKLLVHESLRDDKPKPKASPSAEKVRMEVNVLRQRENIQWAIAYKNLEHKHNKLKDKVVSLVKENS